MTAKEFKSKATFVSALIASATDIAMETIRDLVCDNGGKIEFLNPDGEKNDIIVPFSGLLGSDELYPYVLKAIRVDENKHIKVNMVRWSPYSGIGAYEKYEIVGDWYTIHEDENWMFALIMDELLNYVE